MQWDGSSSTAWNVAANWTYLSGSGAAPPTSADTARFAANTNRDPTLGSVDRAIGKMEFVSGTDAETIGGTADLTLHGVGGSGISNSSGVAATFTAGVQLAGDQTWTTSGAGSAIRLNRTLKLATHTLTLDAGSGTTVALSTGAGDFITSTSTSGSLVKAGAGTLTFGNVANTGFTGGIALNAGTLSAGHNASFGTGALTLAGGTLTSSGDRTFANALLLTAGSLMAGGAGIDLTFSSATISTSGGALLIDNTSDSGVMSVGFGGSGFDFSRPIDLSDSYTELRMLNPSGVQTYSGVISGSGAVRQNGAGGAVVLSGLNSYTGATVVAAGTLRLGVADDGTNSALGTAAAGTSVSSGAALDLNGFSVSTAEGLTISGTGVSSSGALTNAGAATTLSGSLTMSGSASIGGSGNITLDGQLIGNAGLTKIGSNALVLNAASLRTGNTQIDAGIIRLGHANGLGSGVGIITFNGGALDLASDGPVAAYDAVVNAHATVTSNTATPGSAGITHTLGTLNLGPDLVLNTARGANVASGTAGIAFGATTLSGNGNSWGFDIDGGTALTLASVSGAGRSFAVTGNGDMTVTGTIGTGASGAVTMNGSGNLILDGNNTYDGLTNLSSGTLTLNGNNSGAAGGVSMTAGILKIGHDNALGSGTLTLGGGTVTAIGGSRSIGNAVSLAGAAIIQSSSGTLTFSGGITGSGHALTITGAGDTTLTGDISNGTGMLNKMDAGTLTFAGTVNGTTATVGATSLDGGSMVIGNGTQTTTLNTGDFGSAAGTTLTIASGGTVIANYTAGTTLFSGALAGSGTFQKDGGGVLVFDQTFAATNLTLILNGGTLSIMDAQITVGTLHITGDTILDFNNSAGTFLSSANLLIDAGVTVTIQNWIAAANEAAASTIWYATGTINAGTLGGSDDVGGTPLSQINFTGVSGLTPTWVSGAHDGWFDHEIRPTPEPSAYGALLVSSLLGLLGWRRWRQAGPCASGRRLLCRFD